MNNRRYTSADYRYGFSKMEKDHEIKGNGDSYDFGARFMDTRLGRWLNIDPMWQAYPMLSAYVYVANNPISSTDSKGELIIFVNGFARGGLRIVPLLVGAPKPGGQYWSRPFVNNAKKYYKDENVSFANGSGRTGLSIAPLRRRRGEKFAERELEKALNGEPSIFSGEDGKPIVRKLENGTLQWDETIKVVSHSHGGAFGAGIIDYVQSKGATVEEVVNIAPHGHFEAPAGTNTVQVNVEGDPVSRSSGNGNAEDGTDLNITENSTEFTHEKKDKMKYRHYSPLSGYYNAETKEWDNDTFKIIEAAKQQQKNAGHQEREKKD
jgi:RHS repeat-associated protein